MLSLPLSVLRDSRRIKVLGTLPVTPSASSTSPQKYRPGVSFELRLFIGSDARKSICFDEMPPAVTNSSL
eukprot:scaffold8234_cov248-Pinguiococcus_pyrenoidosus.AAC.7